MYLGPLQLNCNSRTRRSHVFDGKTITKETAAFQLCDISDPMLKVMIEDPEGVRDVCHVCKLALEPWPVY